MRTSRREVRLAEQRLQSARAQCMTDCTRLRCRIGENPTTVLAAFGVTGFLVGWLTVDVQASLLGIWRHPAARALAHCFIRRR